jgi:hypothetical protein
VALSVSFDQVAILLLLNLVLWGLLDALHSERHAPLALDGLFGWACYLLLGLTACALIARVQSRQADTRALLVAALSTTPFVLVLAWLLNDLPLLHARPLLITVVALVYLALLTACWRRVRRGQRAAAFARCCSSCPRVLGVLNLDTRLGRGRSPPQSQAKRTRLIRKCLLRPAGAHRRGRAAREAGAAANWYFVGFAGDGDPAPPGRRSSRPEGVRARFGSEGRSLFARQRPHGCDSSAGECLDSARRCACSPRGS